MLFNSAEFLFLFLPLTFGGYFGLLNYGSARAAKIWLFLASLYFYAYWELSYLPLLLASIVTNFLLGRWLLNTADQRLRQSILLLGLIGNISFLGYYKYIDFIIENINIAFASDFSLMHLLLPLAISFFTFQQIAFLVDSYRGEVQEKSFLDYAIFVSFFPQLIAGPIVHHNDMMPQFAHLSRNSINLKNIYLGLFLFSIGLFKKVVIADEMAQWVNAGYAQTDNLSAVGAWGISLSFTMQIVFDFTAYSDMAIGTALLFNIRLPINFYSSLKSASIGEFWSRWHLTLGEFLKRYIYIPLGGNRKGFTVACINLFITFMVAGIWHGSGWNFFIWGILQGSANVLFKLWQRYDFKMPAFMGWILTFNFINIICVFFRAPTFADATGVLQGMVGVNGLVPDNFSYDGLTERTFYTLFAEFKGSLNFLLSLGVASYLAFFTRNSMEIASTAVLNRKTAFVTGLMIGYAILLTFNRKEEFIYFNF